MTGSHNHHIALISKTVAIVETLRDQPEGLSLQELSSQTGQVKSSVHRILRSLGRHRYIEQSSRGGLCRLGIQFLTLANSVRSGSNLVAVARPYSRSLGEQFDESTYIAVLRGGHGVFVDVQETSPDLRLVGPLGAAITERTLVTPAEIEQSWAQVRRAGYPTNDEETIVGTIFLAAPIFDARDSICGSISIGLPKPRYSADLGKRIAAELKQCGQRVSGDLKAAAYVHQNAFDDQGVQTSSLAGRKVSK